MDERLIAFIGIATLVVVVPGPDMALVARNVLRNGRAAGYATSLGICVGTLGWALAAGFGVATILATSSVAFTALKLAGAAYLIYLGIMTLRDREAFAPADPTVRAAMPWPPRIPAGIAVESAESQARRLLPDALTAVR